MKITHSSRYSDTCLRTVFSMPQCKCTNILNRQCGETNSSTDIPFSSFVLCFLSFALNFSFVLLASPFYAQLKDFAFSFLPLVTFTLQLRIGKGVWKWASLIWELSIPSLPHFLSSSTSSFLSLSFCKPHSLHLWFMDRYRIIKLDDR